MGKKKTEQDEIPTPNAGAVANRDLMQRMSFLYQVASHLSQQSHQPHNIEGGQPDKKGKSKRKGSLQDLAAFHVRTIKTIGNKSMVKVDPSIKRTVCKACHTVAIHGQTSHVRIKTSKSHRFVKSQKCHNCGWTRRIPCPPQHKLEEEIENISMGEESSHTLATNMSGREMQPARLAPLFERDGHVVYISNPTGKSMRLPQAKGPVDNLGSNT